jgi:hypothetical protein
MAETQEERARTAPFERSIPPVRITRVIPIPRIFRMAACRTMLRKFSHLRKLGERRLSRSPRRTRMISRDKSFDCPIEGVLSLIEGI